MPRPHRTYTLSAAVVATAIGAGVLCLANEGMGRSYRLHAERPGAHLNRRLDLPSGAAHRIEAVAPEAGALIRVDISGPIEQFAGYHDPCAGWSDGHDAIAERMCAAFEEGDVLLVINSPGGAAAGIQQAVEKVQKSKAHHGRRVTCWINEMMGSAATWWGMGVSDEIYLPPAGQAGSIGARGDHRSIAGMLDKEGIAVEYFTWPNDGKIAFAPEKPLGDVGRMRGQRDVAIAGEAFCEAVCASAVGKRHGLDRDAVVALGADMLTGQAAVDAGLADGVASEDEVIAMALAQAERASGGEGSQARVTARGAAKMPRTGTRAEEERRGEEEEDKGAEPTGKCGHCGMQNEDDAKFCDQCGKSMAAPKMAEEEDDDDDDGPPSSSKPAGKKEEKAAHPPPPERMSATADLGTILGLSADASLPALKTAAISLRQIRDHAAALTGQTSPGAIVGGLSAIAADAGASADLRAQLKDTRRKQARAERWDLAKRLIACDAPGHERGRVLIDAVDDRTGQRILDNGRPVQRLAPVYAEMKLSTFRGLVEGFERNAKPRDPFQPDKARAEQASKGALGGGDATAFTEAEKKRLEEHPTVYQLEARGSALTRSQLVNGLITTNPGSARSWLAQNGAAS